LPGLFEKGEEPHHFRPAAVRENEFVGRRVLLDIGGHADGKLAVVDIQLGDKLAAMPEPDREQVGCSRLRLWNGVPESVCELGEQLIVVTCYAALLVFDLEMFDLDRRLSV
jgi:hypothetical protein